MSSLLPALMCMSWQVAQRCKCKLYVSKRKHGIISQLDLPGGFVSRIKLDNVYLVGRMCS